MENTMLERITNGYNAVKGWATWGAKAAQDPKAAAVEGAENVAVNAAAGAADQAADNAQNKANDLLASVKTHLRAHPVLACTALVGALSGVAYVFGKDRPEVKEFSSSLLESIFSGLGKFAKKVLESLSKRAADAAKDIA